MQSSIFTWQLLSYFSQLSKCRIHSHPSLFSKTLKEVFVSQYRQKKQFGTSAGKFKKELPSSQCESEVLPNDSAPFILDVEKERQKIADEDIVHDELEGLSLERAKTGVIDVDELVDLLRREKGEDIFVVKIPEEYNYADFKVIVTGRSQRHMYAMADLTRRLYKKRTSSTQIPHLEGKNSKTWIALDLGNIILHVFSAAGREVYDLETLWSVGKEYDSCSQEKDISSHDLTDYAKILASLTPNT